MQMGKMGMEHFRRPLSERLSHKRNGRSQKQHHSPATGFLLHNFQRGERLARAAGHDEFAAIFSLEMLMKDRNSLLLMRTRRLFVLTGF